MSVNASTMRLGIAAILVGLVAAYAVRVMLQKEDEVEAEPPAPKTVPLASADLPIGRALKLGDIGIVKMTQQEMKDKGWPMQWVMMSPDQIIGRRLKRELRRGDPFLTTDLFLQGDEGDSWHSLLKPGFRAVHIQVPDTRGGYVKPGTTVDVVFRTHPEPGTDSVPPIPERIVTLAEAVAVLHVVKMESRSNRGPGEAIVTLAVNPEQANTIHVMEAHGDFSLLVRPPGEVIVSGSKSLKYREGEPFWKLLGFEFPEPVPPLPEPEPEPQPIIFNVEYVKGGRRSMAPFQISPQEANSYAAAISGAGEGAEESDEEPKSVLAPTNAKLPVEEPKPDDLTDPFQDDNPGLIP